MAPLFCYIVWTCLTRFFFLLYLDTDCMERFRLTLRTPSNDRPPLSLDLARGPRMTGLFLKQLYCQEHPDLQPANVHLTRRGRLLLDGDILEEVDAEVFVVAPRLSAPAPRPLPAHPEPVPEPHVAAAEGPIPIEPVAAAAAAAVAAAPRLRLGLLVRLAALVLLLAQGGDQSRAALLCFAAFAMYAWSALAVTVAGRLAGAGSLKGELHDLFVPLVLSLNPTWRVDVFLGERVEQVVIPPEDDEEN